MGGCFSVGHNGRQRRADDLDRAASNQQASSVRSNARNLVSAAREVAECTPPPPMASQWPPPPPVQMVVSKQLLNNPAMLVSLLNSPPVSSNNISEEIYALLGDITDPTEALELLRAINSTGESNGARSAQKKVVSTISDHQFLLNAYDAEPLGNLKDRLIECKNNISQDLLPRYTAMIIHEVKKSDSSSFAVKQLLSNASLLTNDDLKDVLTDPSIHRVTQETALTCMPPAVSTEDQEWLADFVCKHKSRRNVVEIEAVGKIHDAKILSSLVLNKDLDLDIRQAAVRQLSDSDTLESLRTNPLIDPTLSPLLGERTEFIGVANRAWKEVASASEDQLLDSGWRAQHLTPIAQATRLERIEFCDGGDAVSTFKDVVKTKGYCVKAPEDVVGPARSVQSNRAVRTVSFESLTANAQIEGYHGRTFIFSQAGKEFACKLLKASEYKSDLAPQDTALGRESAQIDYLHVNAQRLDLRSQLPSANGPNSGIIYLTDVPDTVLSSIDSQSRKSQHDAPGFTLASATDQGRIALVYEHPRDHHVYLNDPELSVERFSQASNIAMHDTGRLMRAGMFNQSPTDFYHDKEDERAYCWNIDEHRPEFERRGAGRLDDWRNGVANPNFRATGIADPKHLQAQQTVGEHVIDIRGKMGDNIFGWALTCADAELRRKELGVDTQLDLAQTMRDGFTSFLSAYTDTSQEASQALLEGLGIDFDLMASQLQYFCAKDYVQDIQQKGTIPERIFGAGVEVAVGETTEGRGWSENNGWQAQEGRDDLGSVNGAFPCQELIKAQWLACTAAIERKRDS